MSDDEYATIKNGLNALAQFQEKLDTVIWQIQKPEIAKLRHISLHIAILSGSLAEICEGWEHAVQKNEGEVHNLTHMRPEILQDIIADLLMHAAQLGNLMEISPYTALAQRIIRNMQRFAPDAPPEIVIPVS